MRHRHERPKAAVHARSQRCDAASLKQTLERVRSILTPSRSAVRTNRASAAVIGKVFFRSNAVVSR